MRLMGLGWTSGVHHRLPARWKQTSPEKTTFTSTVTSRRTTEPLWSRGAVRAGAAGAATGRVRCLAETSGVAALASSSA